MSVKRLWSALNGIVGIYKPPEMSVSSLKRFIVKAVCSDAKESVIHDSLIALYLSLDNSLPETSDSTSHCGASSQNWSSCSGWIQRAGRLSVRSLLVGN